MDQLIVIAFDHLDDARAALRGLRELERDGRVRFEDTALVERDPDGAAHVINEVSGTTETAAAAGALIGGLLTFAFPPAGIALGAAAGAAVGASLDRGVGAAIIDDVKATLRPGRSALLLVVKQADVDAVTAVLRSFPGEVLQSNLSGEAEDALRHAMRPGVGPR
jgi:uncharacterized membrane protein